MGSDRKNSLPQQFLTSIKLLRQINPIVEMKILQHNNRNEFFTSHNSSLSNFFG